METTAVLNAPRHGTTLSSGLLKSERLELTFLPQFGCHWTRLRVSVKGEWVDLLRPVASGDALLDMRTGQGSYVMAPWSNRIPNGRFRFAGQDFQLRTNFRDGSAIHGDVRDRVWTVIDSSDSIFEATLDTSEFEDFNYPFSLRFTHAIELHGETLSIRMTIENTDSSMAPVGLGYHPFVLRRLTGLDDDFIVQVPAGKVYPARGCIPTGDPVTVAGATDLRRLRPLGAPNLDHCFTALEQHRVRLIYPGTGAEVRFDFDPDFTHAVVYAPNLPDGTPASFVAIEPVTHVNDGFNLFDVGMPGTGVKVLEPEETWTTSWRLSVGDL